MDQPKYNKQQFDTFIRSMGESLFKEGLSYNDIQGNSDAQNFIKKYVEDILSPDNVAKDAILGYVRKLSIMKVDVSKIDIREYPVINKYKGHYLEDSTYFKKSETGYDAVVLPVTTSTIILP